MYGTSIGTLELLLDNNVIWSLSGSQDNEWLLAETNIPVGQFQVIWAQYLFNLITFY